MRLLNQQRSVPVAICCLFLVSSLLKAAVTLDTTGAKSHVGPTISPTLTAQLAAVEKLPTIDPTNLPDGGRSAGYFSAQRPLDPPAPGNIFSLPVWDLGDQVYLLDDVDFNYPEAAASYQANVATPMSVTGPPAPGGGGGGTNSGGGTPYLVVFTTNELWLQVTTTNSGGTNLTAYIVINSPWNVTNGVWDIFATTNLAPSAWQWVDRCTPGQTNITLIGMAYPNEFFIAASTNDTDGDGLSDAFETLVSHTNPNLASTDGTGMSDGWELQYFGSISNNPAGDPDGDGLTNYQEFMAGTNPNVPDNYATPLNEPKPVADLP
jgi:hypothetical protein